MEPQSSATQIDLSQIKKAKIQSEKELESEITKICDVLRDTQSHDWKKRTDSLKRIQEIAVLFQDVIEQEIQIGGQFYVQQVQKLYGPLTAQVLDLRSATAKEAGRTIQILAQCMGNDFESLANKFISKDSLIKLLHSGNKVLAEIGFITMWSITENICFPRIIQRLTEEMKGSKNTWAHAKMAHLFYIAMSIYPYEGCIEKYQSFVENLMQQCLSNANPDARQKGRRAFLLWQKEAPHASDQIFKILDYSIQRAIIEEKETLKYENCDEVQVTRSTTAHTYQRSNTGSVYKKEDIVDEEIQQISQQQPRRCVSRKDSGSKSKTPVKGRIKKMASPKQEPEIIQSQINIRNNAMVSQLPPQSRQQTHKQSNSYQNPFQAATLMNNNYVKTNESGDYAEAMEIEAEVFDLKKVLNLVNSTVWYNKVEGFEMFLKNVIDFNQKQLIEFVKQEKLLPQLVETANKILKKDQVYKVLETAMDFFEFIVTSMPELLKGQIKNLIGALINLLQNKKENISQKANDLINVAQEVLTSDLLLPHLVFFLEEIAEDKSLLATKISGLEVLSILTKNATELEEEEQYESIINTVGMILQQHGMLKPVQMPSLSIILSLRDKNLEFTINSLLSLPILQINTIKQLANAYERNFARQILEAQSKQQEQVASDNLQKLNQQIFQQQKAPMQQEQAQTKQQFKPNQVEAPLQGQKSSIVLQNQTNFKQAQNIPVLSSLIQEVKLNQPISQQIQPQVQQQNFAKNKENGSKKQIQPVIQTINSFTPMLLINASQTDTSMSNNDTSMMSIQSYSQQQTNPQILLQNEIIQNYTVLRDFKQSLAHRIQAIRNLQKLNKPSQGKDEDVWKAVFQSVLDSIFYVIINEDEPNQLKEASYELLIQLVQKQSRDNLNAKMKNSFPEISLRQKIFQFCVDNYMQSLAQTSQPILQNQVIDELLEVLSKKSDVEFLVQSVCPQIRVEQPPKLQALIRMVQHSVKSLIENDLQNDNYNSNIIAQVLKLSPTFAEVINNQNADVRKSVVFCLVDIHTLVGDELFDHFMSKLNPSQQKLVDIYIKRKKEMAAQKQSIVESQPKCFVQSYQPKIIYS